MFNQADAEALGWSFTVAGEEGTAVKKDEDGNELRRLDATSGVPLFALISAVSDLEGYPVNPTNSDGSIPEVTPELVQQVSGETWNPEPLPDVPVPQSAAVTNLEAAVNAVISAPDFDTAKQNLAALLPRAQ